MIWGTWSLPSLHLQTNRPGSEKGGHLCHVLSIIKIGDVVHGKIRRWESGDVPDSIVWGQDIHSVLTTGRHCHTHLCISLYTQILSMGRLRRDRCNFVKWFSSVLELTIFQFLCKTSIKILLNILINASYIFLTNISPERNINVAVIIFFFYKTCMKKESQMLVLYRFFWLYVL